MNRFALITVVAGLLLTGCGADKALLQEQEEELKKLRHEMEQLDQRLEAEQQALEKARADRDRLQEDLETEQQRTQAFKNEMERMRSENEGQYVLGNRIILPSSVLFAPGQAVLSDRGRVYLDEVWETLGKHPKREILIEGHTDNIPIGSGYTWKYATNWELSSARALAVLHYIEGKRRVNPTRLGAVAYGEHRPTASNRSSQGRAQNRRVEIVIGRELE